MHVICDDKIVVQNSETPLVLLRPGDRIRCGGLSCVVTAVEYDMDLNDLTLQVTTSEGPEQGHTLLEDLLRFHVLVRIFDGDINRWARFLTEEASAAQVRSDAEFVARCEEALRNDPSLMRRIQALVATSSELLFREANPGSM
jgi:hypothetical protein